MKKLIDNYFERLKATIDSLNKEEIETFVKLLQSAFESESTIFVMGNGGSASTASHFACDIAKGVSFAQDKRFRIVCLNDNIPTIMAYSNDLSYEDIFVEQLKNLFKKGDLVIGFSGSGNSKNVLKAVEYANSNGGKTVGVTGYGGGKLKEIAQFSVNTNVDDMQISEDLHMVLVHIAMQVLIEKSKITL